MFFFALLGYGNKKLAVGPNSISKGTVRKPETRLFLFLGLDRVVFDESFNQIYTSFER